MRDYVSNRIAHINRRFIKKAAFADPTDDVPGYKSMDELCKDLDGLINIIWLSGTRTSRPALDVPFPNYSTASLQIPYFLSIASELNTWLPSFPPSPKETLSILRKLDHCFASLLAGEDADTKEPLPGFENGTRLAGMSRTHMVRCKSTVQDARMVVMNVLGKEQEEEEEEEEDGETEEAHGNNGSDSEDDGPMDWDRIAPKQKQQRETREDEEQHLDMARVYEKTIVQLGIALADGEIPGDIQISDD